MPRAVSATLLAVALSLPGFARASTWEIDPAHTSANFAVRHLVISTVRGTMGKVSGTATLDEGDVTRSSVTASIDAAGVDTRDAKRDQHLRSPDFLDVAKYPAITFTSKRVEAAGEGRYRVVGDLTLHGVTREVSLDVEGSPTPIQDPFGNTRLGGTAKTTLDRRDFGINWSKALDGGGLVVGDEVEVTVDVELIRKR